jgi:tetratricopeptide (TPR) repeat protein
LTTFEVYGPGRKQHQAGAGGLSARSHLAAATCELCKIKRDYQGALECFGRILQIDPEDLSAHYNLMAIYRKLRRTEEAKREGKIFADLKDDPAALSLANQFLRKHPEMSNESVYWHLHDLRRTPGE